MYRAVTLYFLQNNISLTNPHLVETSLSNIAIFLKNEQDTTFVFLNDINVTDEIRTMAVSAQVSEVAAISSVRSFLVKKQKEFGLNKGVVMDGRDIGSVVFPEAELKLFIKADIEIRSKRRLNELHAKGKEVSLEDVKENLLHRDMIDSTRKDSPLTQTHDSILLDNSNLSPGEILIQAYDLALNKIANG